MQINEIIQKLTEIQKIQLLQLLSDLTFSYIKSELTKLNQSGVGQIRLGKICGVDRKTINDLLHGRIDSFKTETLVKMSSRLIEYSPNQVAD